MARRPSAEVGAKAGPPPNPENPHQLGDTMMGKVFSYFDLSSFFAARRVSPRWRRISEPWRAMLIQVSGTLPDYLNERSVTGLYSERSENPAFGSLLDEVDKILNSIQKETVDDQICLLTRFIEVIKSHMSIPSGDGVLAAALSDLGIAYYQKIGQTVTVRGVGDSNAARHFPGSAVEVDLSYWELGGSIQGAAVRRTGIATMQDCFLTYIALAIANLNFGRVFQEKREGVEIRTHFHLEVAAMMMGDTSNLLRERQALTEENDALLRRLARRQGRSTLGLACSCMFLFTLLTMGVAVGRGSTSNYPTPQSIKIALIVVGALGGICLLIGIVERRRLRHLRPDMLQLLHNEERLHALNLQLEARGEGQLDENAPNVEEQRDVTDYQPLLDNALPGRRDNTFGTR